ncbi:MAG: class I SAM-dependent methyltransferase [Terriglobia bacterium]
MNLNDLEKYFQKNTSNRTVKWKHYLEIYDRHFSRFRGTDVHLVEIGVFDGGSLQMWKSYFGPRSRIYGVDVDPNCKQLEEEQISIFIGDQSDEKFLRVLAKTLPRIDILIDDGGHKMNEQIITFDVLFPHIDKEGIYVCEDLHTSYWKKFGGGFRRKGTFIEYSKGFIDSIHAWHSKEPQKLAVSHLTRSIHSLHFYNSLLVIEKRPMEEPSSITSGSPTLDRSRKPSSLRRFVWSLHSKLG